MTYEEYITRTTASGHLILRTKSGVRYEVHRDSVEAAHDTTEDGRHYVYGLTVDWKVKSFGRREAPGSVKWFFLENLEEVS